MQTIPYREITNNFDEWVEKVSKDREPVIITGNHNSAVVLLSLEEYDSIQETLYLLSDCVNVAHLRKSIEDIEEGRGIKVDLADL